MLVRDLLYGNIEYSDSESKLIECQSFERLRRIKQLSFSEFIYPSATHNRFAHSLGVCHIATQMFNAISLSEGFLGYFKPEDLDLLRLIALSHDIGHSPFSHSSEELSPISHEERMVDILSLERSNLHLEHPDVSDCVSLISDTYLGTGLTYMKNPRLLTLNSLMDSFIDADKMDYLYRDAHYCGINYGFFDRDDLLSNLCLISQPNSVPVVGLGTEGLHALESFILARYYMFSQVYFNPKRRLYDLLFCEEMKDILPDGKYPESVRKFLQWDDTKVIHKLSFLQGNPYTLVYDNNFYPKVKTQIDRKLGRFLICDTPRKTIFRNSQADANILIRDSLWGTTYTASELSPIIRGFEFSTIHKLRYYTESSIANEMREEIRVILLSIPKEEGGLG